MPRKNKSINARIAEHEKYRRQCKVRLSPSLQLNAVALAIASYIVWSHPENWQLAAALLGFPTLFTAMEFWGYYRHDKAIKELQNALH